VNDLWSPEINSIPVPIPTVQGCNPLPDRALPSRRTRGRTASRNIRCYDQFKVQAVLNWIDGNTHDGSATAPVPNVFGMNFQAVSVGQKLVEKSLGLTGGYVDALGTPSDSLFAEIQYVDGAIGQFVSELKKQGLLDSTLIIVSAKHGQSPIDPSRVLRIPGEVASDEPPSQILSPAGVGPGLPVAQADEDDISMLWLTDQSQTESSVATLALAANENLFGQGEISLALAHAAIQRSADRFSDSGYHCGSERRCRLHRRDEEGCRARRLRLRRPQRSADCLQPEVQGCNL